MKIKNVKAIYFSPTGGTKKLVLKFASAIADKLGVSVEEIRLMSPEARKEEYTFGPDELVILATPTYAGRVPNKIEPDLRKILSFDGSPAVALATFGNRSYGTSPQELADIMSTNGAKVFAAGAFVCRHCFTDKVARKRPDREDKAELDAFAERVTDAVLKAADTTELGSFKGDIEPYYRPLKEDGTPAVFLKAKPETRIEDCYRCGLCAKVCPMGSIDADCVTVSGICIKCQACVHSCPTKAKYFDDPEFLSHVRMLEENFTERADNFYSI